MRARIFTSMTALTLAAVLFTAALITGALYSFFTERQLMELKSEARYIAAAMDRMSEPEAYVQAISQKGGERRLTWIGADGQVLFDSDADTAAMENHLERPEVVQAIESGTGSDTRNSATLGEKTSYCAVRLEDGGIVRISGAEKNVLGIVSGMLGVFGLIVLAAMIASVFVAGKLTGTIVKPINSLNLERPDENEVYEELTPLLSRIHAQNRQIDAQIRELTRRQREFVLITDSMSEGMVLLDERGQVLSANRSAALLLGASGSDMAGRHIYEISRVRELMEAVEAAQAGSAAERVMERDARSYQLLARPVTSGKKVIGVLILILDVTEKLGAERLRREFSANVSHELKTPLTSISGYSEIIMSGVAQPEDVAGFAGKIHDEAGRMLKLIDDIMTLSNLDENTQSRPAEPVNLLDMARDVARRLNERAQKRAVDVQVTGAQACCVRAIRPLLDEMLTNLTDNAIRYNVEGGKVRIDVADTPEGGARVTVSDTGIGIAPEHLSRVFERFYRVDKSHSKATGGTGLGLSIVKHAAQANGARIFLESEPGSGTRVQVLFPPEKICRTGTDNLT